MISQCMNPDCRRDLHYLRDGRVVRCVLREQERVTLEHFWLCGDCHLNYEFRFSADGSISLARRHVPSTAKSGQPFVLTLVA
jgi:LSD1 subclass zinc finger protein